MLEVKLPGLDLKTQSFLHQAASVLEKNFHVFMICLVLELS